MTIAAVFLALGAAAGAAQTSQPIPIPTLPPRSRGSTEARTPPAPKPPAPKKAPESARPAARTAPQAKPAAAPDPARDPFDMGLSFAPLPPVAVPAVVSATLPNGIKLLLLENRELPLIRGRVVVRTGRLLDPPGKPGVAELTGRVLRAGGTRSKTVRQLDEELENIAASIETSIGEASGQVTFDCLSANVEAVLPLLVEILSEPEFRQDRIDAEKVRLAAELARRDDDAQTVILREMSERIYGRDTPYGMRLERRHLDGIERADLTAFHQRYFFPANAIVAVQGDFDAEGMKSRLERAFAAWTASQPPVPAFPEVRPRPSPGIFVGRFDIPQTLIAIGQLGGRLDEPDAAALQVMADILGGSLTSRLSQRLRAQMGWALRNGADWFANYGHPGMFVVSAVAKPHAAAQVIRAVLEEIDRIRTAEVSRQELDRARDRAVNSYVFQFDHPEKTLDRLLAYEYFGYPRDFAAQRQKALSAVTAADVLRAARQHIRPQDLTVVMIGNPRDSAVPLEDLRIKVEDFPLASAPGKASEMKTDEQSAAEARELLARTQRALGGADRLSGVADYMHTSEMAVAPPANLRIKTVERFIAPTHYRQDQELPFGRLSVYTDGGSGGWARSPQGQVGTAPLLNRLMQGELFRLFFRAALSDQLKDRRIAHAGGGLIQIGDRQGNRLDLWVDEETGLPRKQAYETLTVQGSPIFVEETFLEWRDIQGIKTPWKSSLTVNGKPYAEITLLECLVNSGLKVEEIGRKP
jgi:zinc protease